MQLLPEIRPGSRTNIIQFLQPAAKQGHLVFQVQCIVPGLDCDGICPDQNMNTVFDRELPGQQAAPGKPLQIRIITAPPGLKVCFVL